MRQSVEINKQNGGELVTTELLSVRDERLWIDKFAGWSFHCIKFGLVEAVIVGYISFSSSSGRLVKPADIAK